VLGKEGAMKTKNRKARLRHVATKPTHEKLPWPGLKAKDHLSRVATQAVKEAKETRERETWAENQIARVLEYVPPDTALKLVFRELSRRRRAISRSAKSLLKRLFQ
jgi:hypothetical protein